MTAAIHHFPVPAAFVAQREAEARRAEIVAAARAVLRSAADHDDAILIEACTALMTWGDGTDWLEADAMQLAVRLRARRRARDAAKAAALAKARKGTIRRALADCMWLALVAALALAVYLAGP